MLTRDFFSFISLFKKNFYYFVLLFSLFYFIVMLIEFEKIFYCVLVYPLPHFFLLLEGKLWFSLFSLMLLQLQSHFKCPMFWGHCIYRSSKCSAFFFLTSWIWMMSVTKDFPYMVISGKRGHAHRLFYLFTPWKAYVRLLMKLNDSMCFRS